MFQKSENKKLSVQNYEDEDNYVSMYQKYNSDLEELMRLDMNSNMEGLDKAWTDVNPYE